MTTEPAKVNAAYEAIDIIARTNGSALLFPVWGTDGKTCRCPKGAACGSPGKHPAVNDWDEQAHRDAQRIEKSLGNPGTPNYGITPRGRLLIMDADGPAQRAAMKGWMRAVGIETTFVVKSGREDGGMHYYFWLPEGVDPADAPNYLWLTEDVKVLVRSAGRNGYVVGPGSVHASGKQYRVVADFDIAVIPVEALRVSRMMEPKAKAAASGEPVITIHETYELPERVTASDVRYYAIRDYAAHLYNRGLSAAEAFGLVKSELLPRFDVPLTEPEAKDRFDRSWAGITESLGPPASTPEGKERFKEQKKAEEEAAEAEEAESVGWEGVFVNIVDYNAAVPDTVDWLGPLGFHTGVSLITGPAKGGKSTLMSSLWKAREAGGDFLGYDIPAGPMVLATEEGGHPVKMKTGGLTTLMVADRRQFTKAGLKSFDQLLTTLRRWCEAQDSPALVTIDTLKVWSGMTDENDSDVATKVLERAGIFAQDTEASVDFIHHTRKGGGSFGEGIRGSTAILASVDHSAEFMRHDNAKAGDLRRRLEFLSRAEFPHAVLDIVWDPVAKLYLLDMSAGVTPTESLLTPMPIVGSGLDGWPTARVEGLFPKNGRRRREEAEADGLIVKVWGGAGKAAGNLWFRRKPLLDLSSSESVGSRMSDIFHTEVDDDD